MFSSPAEEYEVGQKYLPTILNGYTVSVYDSMTQALTAKMATEYFLSPSGVVDLGTERIPVTFNPDGTVKTYREVNSWKGADTDKSFFLIANTDMAGQNDLGLGFDGTTAKFTDKSDVNQATPALVLSHEIMTSGASKHDLMFGYDGWEYDDLMFGHGGDDWMQGEGGRNYLVGGAGADKFIIEAVGQNTKIIGDHVNIDNANNKWERDASGENYVTSNDSYGDNVFFDFTWPLVGPNGEKSADSYIEQLGKNHFKVHHKLDNGEEINVELYDVEGAYFSDGEGGLEYHALTTGRPITKDDFGQHLVMKLKRLSSGLSMMMLIMVGLQLLLL